MATEQLPGQGELEALLARDPVWFMEALDLSYRKILARYIERWTCGMLDPEELKDAYQETMVALWERVQQPGFDPRCAATNGVYDCEECGRHDGRQRLRKPLRVDHEAVAQAVGEDLTGTQAGLEWRLLSPDERREFQDAVADIIARLPPRQQMAALAFWKCTRSCGRKTRPSRWPRR